MTICSFLPSATEILYALGLDESVAGVTYECDYPPEARTKPVVVHTSLPASVSAAEIHRRVGEFVARGESLYEVDPELLRAIEPRLIVTQDLCLVCAASPNDLASVLATLPSPPQVLCLNPRTVNDVWNDILAVGEATGQSAEAQRLVAALARRVRAVGKAVARLRRPRILCLEWLDPPIVAGHWVPEMVTLAGGTDVLGRVGEPGYRVSWEAALATDAEVVVAMPCGYGLSATLDELRAMRFPAGWEDLPAVRDHRVFAVDASSYFSRPGPRLATGIELLAFLFHAEQAPTPPPPAAVARC